MPSAAPRACACGAVVPAGKRCSRCSKAHDQQRGSPSQRGYDAAWQQLRERFIEKHPLCSVPHCGSITTEVDHILTVRERPDLRLQWSNLRPMCRHHHSQRTMNDRHAARKAVERGKHD